MKNKLVLKRAGQIFSICNITTLNGARRSKTRQQLRYGASLSGEWFDADGVSHFILC